MGSSIPMMGGGLTGCKSKVPSNPEDDGIIGYMDSNYAMDPDSHHSVSGAIFLLTGGPISWSSKLQASVSQSSTEAEYIASTEAAKEAVWLCRLMKDLKQDTTAVGRIFVHYAARLSGPVLGPRTRDSVKNAFF